MFGDRYAISVKVVKKALSRSDYAEDLTQRHERSCHYQRSSQSVKMS